MLTVYCREVQAFQDSCQVSLNYMQAKLCVGNVSDQHLQSLTGNQVDAGVLFQQELRSSQLHYYLKQTINVNIFPLKNKKVPFVLNSNDVVALFGLIVGGLGFVCLGLLLIFENLVVRE